MLNPLWLKTFATVKSVELNLIRFGPSQAEFNIRQQGMTFVAHSHSANSRRRSSARAPYVQGHGRVH
ncbi:hypothetical protein BN2476_680025 [Paraburkholderia piptadeniae]|uniref:Uncharacterized protein n=1 Tax=Paraburkholderia piptadeniae TaxID=1701573 RepID=A0A1N7SPH8_9BURK|nr:hypothetical protein BN2476_680025 [Paraburkholderia piptadeniae]